MKLNIRPNHRYDLSFCMYVHFTFLPVIDGFRCLILQCIYPPYKTVYMQMHGLLAPTIQSYVICIQLYVHVLSDSIHFMYKLYVKRK